MAHDQEKQEDRGTAPQLTTMEVLVEDIVILNETVKMLGERIAYLELEKQGITDTLRPEEAKDKKAIMAEKLKEELEKQLNTCKGKIKSLLFRAKFVDKKGLKIEGEIEMKNTADVKEKERIGVKLTETITANKSCITTLTARAIHVKEKHKEAEYRVRVAIK